mmetsp:Transcript_69759/g.145774  ORF Transcript_69759/g.145774 Transcript_69759/m.145774 type:complete len:236 (-) Transcript_69759:2011-2718(-)
MAGPEGPFSTFERLAERTWRARSSLVGPLHRGVPVLEQRGFDVVPSGFVRWATQVEVVVGVDVDDRTLDLHLAIEAPLNDDGHHCPNEATSQDVDRQVGGGIVDDHCQNATAHRHEDEALQFLHKNAPLPFDVWCLQNGEEPQEETDGGHHYHLQQRLRRRPLRHDRQSHLGKQLESQSVKGLRRIGVEEAQVQIGGLSLGGQSPGVGGFPDLHVPEGFSVDVLGVSGADSVREQ